LSLLIRFRVKNWKKEEELEQSKKLETGKIGDSGTKPVILKYCNCTKFCKHLATAGEIMQQEF